MTEEEIGRLVVRIVGDTTSVRKEFTGVENLVKKTGETAKKESKNVEVFGKTIDDLGTKMSNMAGQMMAFRMIQSPFESLKEAVASAGQMEGIQLAFKTIIGDAVLAKQTVADLVDFADRTPFELPGILNASKMMMAMGTAAEDIVPTMNMLGDVASGLDLRLEDLTYVFGTLRSQGRAFTQDINQFAMRGIPIWAELEKQFGKTNAEVRRMVEEGKVGFKDVELAFKNMTGEGGRFHDMMEEQSKSFPGMMSTLRDAIAGVGRTVGKNVIEMFRLKEIIGFLTEAAKFAEQRLGALTDVIKFLITAGVGLTAVGLAGVAMWKVYSIAIGMVVGVLKHVVETLPWVIRGIHGYVSAISIAKVATVALTLAVVGLAAAALYHLTGMSSALKEYNEQVNIGVVLTNRLLDAHTKRTDKEIEAAKALSNPLERREALGGMLAGREANVAGQAAHMNRLKEQISALDDLITDGNPFKIMGRRRQREALKKELEDITKLYEKHKEDIKRLKTEIDATNPAADPAILKGVSELTNSMAIQAATWGMTAREAEIYKMVIAGATSEQLVAARQWNLYLTILETAKELEKKAAEETKRRADAVKNLTDRLVEENMALRFTNDEMEIHKLIANGASIAQIAFARLLQESTKAMRQHNSFMEEGRRITEQFRSPQEIFNQEIAKLTTLFMTGAISISTYTVAMADAKKNLEDAEKGAAATRKEMERLDAVMAGSAEAKARIAAFAERNKGPDLRPTINRGVATTVNAENAPMLRMLREIADNTGVVADKPVIELEGASIK